MYPNAVLERIYKSTCAPANNALYYFTKFGNPNFTSTLNNGTVVSFPTSQSMHIVNPVLQSKLPWTNNGISSALCQHTKPGGIYFIMAIYNKSISTLPKSSSAITDTTHAQPTFADGTCGCLPPTTLFVSLNANATIAAALTSAAASLLASDELYCVKSSSAAATASTLSTAAAWTANMLLVTNQSTTLSARIAAAQAFVTTCNNTAVLLSARAAFSASIAAQADLLAPTSGANHAALQVDVNATIDASNSVIANSAVLQAQFVLATVTANSNVLAILNAQQAYIASHAAALNITIAVTNQSTSLSSRIAIAAAFVTTCNNTAVLLAAKANVTASIAAAADLLAPASGANHAALQVDVTASIDAGNSAIANGAVVQALFVLATVTANTNVAAILSAEQAYIASHAAALNTTPLPLLSRNATSAISSVLVSLQAADQASATSLALLDLSSANALLNLTRDASAGYSAAKALLYSPPLSCVSAPSTPLIQSCSCLPTTALFVSVDASLSTQAKAALTAAAVALLAADQSFCVNANAVAVAAQVAATAANHTANMLLVTNPSTTLSSRIAIASAYVVACNNSALLLAAKANVSASIAAAADLHAPISGANHAALQVDFVAMLHHNVSMSTLVTFGLHSTPVLLVLTQGKRFRYIGPHTVEGMLGFLSRVMKARPLATLEAAKRCSEDTDCDWQCKRWDGEATPQEVQQEESGLLLGLCVVFLVLRVGVPQGCLRLKELRRGLVRQRLRQRGVTRSAAPAFLLRWDPQNTTDMSALSSEQTSGETRPPAATTGVQASCAECS
ncbi:MAG: hypothetical protein WDW38_002815 [Sanguina aurantia]